MLADAGVLEEGDAAEVGGVTAALRTNQNTPWFSEEPGQRRKPHLCSHTPEPDHQHVTCGPAPHPQSHTVIKHSLVSDASGAAAAAKAPP